MNIIYLILCVVILQVHASKKIKICIPKKKKLNDVEQVEKSFRSSFLRDMPDEINIPGNFSLPLSIKELISANVTAGDITISGLRDYSIKLIPTEFTLNKLKIRGGYYKLEGEVSDLFDIYGNGTFEISLGNIAVDVNNILPSWPFFRCFKVNIIMKLQEMKASFNQLMGGDELLEPVMNNIIGDMGPDIIDYYWPLIYDTLQPIIQAILDQTINKDGFEEFPMSYVGNHTILQNQHIGKSLEILSKVLFSSL